MAKFFTVEQRDSVRVGRRRITFFTSIFFLTSLATWFMADLLWRGHMGALEWVILILFVILFANISVGFCTAMIGFYVINRRGDPYRISRDLESEDLANLPLATTAIVMPVFNEDPTRVFAGLRAIYESLERTGQIEHFDFFILSDSNDPNRWIQEEIAWIELCKELGAFGQIFYRKRRVAINKKSGNVADFLRRWGRSYRYMAVLDADSIMAGECLVRLVAMMERNPKVGIVQTAPHIVNGDTLYARLQQFSNRVYSPLFLAGMNYWHQSEGNFWGHNAVIRVAPFINFCCLPELPGREPFGGRILSHDFVEAALMRKAGWAVWLAYDLEGSYEEGPPTLIDNAKRDRRWCQGNMQHSWLLFAHGFHPANRFHLLMGILGYVASPLWMFFLLLSSILTFKLALAGELNRFNPEVAFSVLGYRVEMGESLALFWLTLLLLFLPKLIGLILVLRDRAKALAYGGKLKLVVSALLEMTTSTLLAPISMMFNTRFVFYSLLGQGVSWGSQRRSTVDGTSWREAFRVHAFHTIFGLIWGISAFVLVRSYFWWLSPVLAGLIFSIPLSVLLSRASYGQKAREVGLLLIPEETQPPSELTAVRNYTTPELPDEEVRIDYGLLQAVLDPYVNAMHVALLRQRQGNHEVRRYFVSLRARLLSNGPQKLTVREKMALLMDAESMLWLHEHLWQQPAESLSEWWRVAMRQYNVLTVKSARADYI